MGSKSARSRHYGDRGSTSLRLTDPSSSSPKTEKRPTNALNSDASTSNTKRLRPKNMPNMPRTTISSSAITATHSDTLLSNARRKAGVENAVKKDTKVQNVK